MAALPTVTLKPGHVRPVFAGHPWIFAQAVASVEGGALAGDEVKVCDPRGNVLGRGLFSPKSAIAVRMFTRDGDTAVDAALFRRRIAQAVALRADLGLPGGKPGLETDAFRLVHAEGDGLPGLVVDVFGDVVSVQFGTAGVKRREGVVLDAIAAELSPRAVVDRSSQAAARLEGFDPGAGVVRGDASASVLEFRERGIRYRVPLALGQKTGFYLDQRPLRARVEELASGRRVLDTYCFVGSFAMAAARGGAKEVVAVDASAVAIEVGAELARENGLGERVRFVREDAKEMLEQVSRKGSFDLVILDPPKLAPARGARDAALGLYQKLAASGCRATRPGGLLVLCSCSSAIGHEALARALALGAREANMTATVLERFFQGPDHPVPSAFPEGLYLSSIIARVTTI